MMSHTGTEFRFFFYYVIWNLHDKISVHKNRAQLETADTTLNLIAPNGNVTSRTSGIVVTKLDD